MDEAQDVLFVMIILWLAFFLRWTWTHSRGRLDSQFCENRTLSHSFHDTKPTNLLGARPASFSPKYLCKKQLKKSACAKIAMTFSHSGSSDSSDSSDSSGAKGCTVLAIRTTPATLQCQDMSSRLHVLMKRGKSSRYSRSFPCKHANTVHTTITHFFLCSHDIRTLHIIFGFQLRRNQGIESTLDVSWCLTDLHFISTCSTHSITSPIFTLSSPYLHLIFTFLHRPLPPSPDGGWAMPRRDPRVARSRGEIRGGLDASKRKRIEM